MSRIVIVAIFLLNTLIVGFVNAQNVNRVVPIPGDPLELATGRATIADTPEKRSTILNLLERARQNNNLHMNGMNAFDLKVSFNSTGPAAYAAAGDLEESWLSNATWKWTAHLGAYSQVRIFHNGVAYDFHGRSIARRISIVENSTPVVEIQLNDIEDLNTTDASVFTPSPDMKGPGIMIGQPMRFPQIAKNGSALPSPGVQPVIIQAVLDASGKVLEAEALQSSDSLLSEAALKLVTNTSYGPVGGREPLERDVFINVQFVSSQ